MATAKPDVVDEDQVPEEAIALSWEWRVEPPPIDEVKERLESLGTQLDVPVIDFIDYVLPMPQQVKTGRKVMAPPPNTNARVLVDEKVTVYRLYMTVAGRLAMLEKVRARFGGRVRLRPAPVTPTGIPGILVNDAVIVARYELTFWDADNNKVVETTGTAWVPGGDQRRNAAASNPFEKVETAAIGRALAAAGLGLLPGSGVASLEEAQEAVRQQNAPAPRQAGPGTVDGGRGGKAPSRDELIAAIVTGFEEARQLRQQDEEWKLDKIRSYVTDQLHVTAAVAEDGSIKWDELSPAHLGLFRNAVDEQLRNIRAQEQGSL